MSRDLDKKKSKSEKIIALYLGFGLIILLIVMLALFGLWRYAEVNTSLDKVVNIHNTHMNLASRMRVSSRERATVLYAMAHTADPFKREEMHLEFLALGEQFLKARAKLVNLTLNPTEQKLLEQHREFAKTIVPQQHFVINLIDEEKFVEAMEFLVNTLVPLQTKALQLFGEFVDYQQIQSNKSLEQAKDAVNITYTLMLFLATLGVLASSLIAGIVSGRIGAMISALQEAKEELEAKVQERTIELRQANEHLEILANQDPLTGLPNRASFCTNLELVLNQAGHRDQEIALLFIDLDGFKQVNDAHGHDVGDELLKQVAQRLSDTLRNADMVARIGGDEFTVILPGNKATAGAELVANKIISALNKPFQIQDTRCHIGCSIGIALFPEHASDSESLVKLADTMMYAVKKSGRNSYLFFDQKLLTT